MKKKLFALSLIASSVFSGLRENASAQGTAFGYQGTLDLSGIAAKGNYDFEFYLRDAATNGNPAGATNFLSGVPVTNGMFAVTLDFGANFPGAARWLEIGVRTNGLTSYTVLAPRQPVYSTPYAIYASTAGNATLVGGINAAAVASGASAANGATAANLPGAIVQRTGDGSFAANGSGLTNVPAGSLTGLLSPAQGALPIPSIFFYGAKGGGNDDSAAFQAAEASGQPVYCPPSTFYTFTNLTVTHNGFEILGENTVLKFDAGCQGNFISVATNVVGFQLRGVILDGQTAGFQSFDGAEAKAWYETAATNIVRQASGSRTGVFISAMATNGVISHVTARNFSDAGFRFTGGAGHYPAPRMAALVFDNDIALNNWIGVDYTNDGEYMTSTGYQARNNGWGANIAAGNTVISGASFIQNGVGARVFGGVNAAHGQIANSSFKHDQIGFMLIGSNNGFDFSDCFFDAVGVCLVTNFSGLYIHGGQFQPIPGVIVDGSHGVGGMNRIEHTAYLGAPPLILTVNGGLCVYNENFNVLDLTGANVGTNAVNMTFSRPMLATGITNSGPTELDGGLSVLTTVPLAPGNTNLATFANPNGMVSWLDTNGNWYATGSFNANTFVNLSDRNAKDNFQAVSPRAVLAKVAALPMSRWSYKTDCLNRHLGPMAQDFYAAFGLGADDRHITTVDESGVALTAIQGLNELVQEKDAQIAALEKRMAALEAMMRKQKANH